MSVLVLDPETIILNVLFYILSEFCTKKCIFKYIFIFTKKKKPTEDHIIQVGFVICFCHFITYYKYLCKSKIQTYAIIFNNCTGFHSKRIIVSLANSFLKCI